MRERESDFESRAAVSARLPDEAVITASIFSPEFEGLSVGVFVVERRRGLLATPLVSSGVVSGVVERPSRRVGADSMIGSDVAACINTLAAVRPIPEPGSAAAAWREMSTVVDSLSASAPPVLLVSARPSFFTFPNPSVDLTTGAEATRVRRLPTPLISSSSSSSSFQLAASSIRLERTRESANCWTVVDLPWSEISPAVSDDHRSAVVAMSPPARVAASDWVEGSIASLTGGAEDRVLGAATSISVEAINDGVISERSLERRVASGFKRETCVWPPPDRRRFSRSKTTLVGPKSTVALPFSAEDSSRCVVEAVSILAADDSKVRWPVMFAPEIFAAAVVSALKALVGTLVEPTERLD